MKVFCNDVPTLSVTEEASTASTDSLIVDSIKQPSTKPLSRSLTYDFKMFEVTKKRTEHLEMMFQSLMPVLNSESERAFLTGFFFCTKVRSRMSDE